MADRAPSFSSAEAGSPSDAELLRQHVAGDPDAFAVLVRRHRDRLWSVALHTLGDAEEAADAVQDALLSAFRNAATFRGDSAVTTWLHRIVVNASLDRIRRRNTRRTVPLPETGSDDPAAFRVEARYATADPTAERETAMDVIGALRHLPHEQRAAL